MLWLLACGVVAGAALWALWRVLGAAASPVLETTATRDDLALGLSLSACLIAFFFSLNALLSLWLWRHRRPGAVPATAPADTASAGGPDGDWREALLAMQEAMLLIDKKGLITAVNARVSRITAIEPEQLINHSYMDVILDGCMEPRCGLTITLDTTGYGECIHRYQGRINDVRIYSIDDKDHSIDKKKVCVIRDITNMKEAEEALTDYTGRLQSSNRELQEFAYVASHDLQEPLRKIQTFAERMRDKCRDQLNDQGRDYLDRMSNAADRMQRLIHDLLIYSRVSTRTEPFERVELRPLIEEVLGDLHVRMEKTGARVIIGDLPAMDADPSQMRQLFQNLISNALKFTREGVTPEIRIDAGAIDAKGLCHITVADNGIGFDNKYADRIFGMFQRLHGRSQYDGTGIGLAVCKKIVERHRGGIVAQGTEGGGATFVISLPVHQRAAAA